RIDFEQRRIVESGHFVPVSELRSSLGALKKQVERAGRNIKPGNRGVGCLALGQSQAAKLEQVRSGREAEVEIDTCLEPRNDGAVAGPGAVSRARDVELDWRGPDPPVDLSSLRAPRTIAREIVVEPRRNSLVDEDRTSVQLPTDVAFSQGTRIVPRTI